MAKDEHILRGGYISTTESGGLSITSTSRKSKKVKQEKVPQRGLGVAQLERIRIEEQRKKEALQAANTLANNVIGSLVDSVHCPNFRSTVSPSPNSMPSVNVLHRPAPPIPNVEILHRSSSQILDGGKIGVESISSPRKGNRPKSWNGELNLEEEKPLIERQVNLPYEANVLKRSHQFHHPLTMVNSSSEFSKAFLLSSQTEPPSNQSFRGNNCANSGSEEDKIVVGMKRSYPLSLESPPTPSYRCNVPFSSLKPDQFASCSYNRYAAHMEPRNTHIREISSNSITFPDPERDSSELIRDEERLKGAFLTLATPSSATFPPSNSKPEHLLHYSSGHRGRELSDSKCLRSQENPRGQIQQLGPSGSTEQQPPFCFFPVKFDSDQKDTCVGIDKDETIDLSLKL